MKITQLVTKNDKSYFETIELDFNSRKELGRYTRNIPVKNATFREFEAGLTFDWHTAPQMQYIIYLKGEVEVEASGGETRRFLPGDVLFATDTKGKGHITRTLTDGLSMIVAI